MRLMTYNIRHGLGNASPGHGEGAVDLARTADVIRMERPDIVALQEVDRHWARSGDEDQPARLAALLGMNVQFAANVTLASEEADRPPCQYGVAVVSRFPIVDAQTVPLPLSSGWEPRGMLIARIDLGSREIVVINAHLQVDQPGHEAEGRWQRRAQAAAVARAVRDTSLPVVVTGDFNAQPNDLELTPLLADGSGLRDVWRAIGHGPGPTIPASPGREPQDRIDYILASRDFTLDTIHVVDHPLARRASDHYPVVADLTLGGGD